MKAKNRFMVPTRPDGLGKNGLSVIILSSLVPNRMKSYGPKCLLKDKYGITILQNQMEIIKLFYPKAEIIVVGGFEIDKLVKHKPAGVRIVENQLYEETNEIEEIRLGLNNALYDNVLITFGDIYFNQSLIRDFSNKESTIIVDTKQQMLVDDVGVTIVDDYATIMSFSIDTAKWCKIALLSEKELKLLRTFVSDRNNKKLFFHESLNYILDKNGSLKAFYTNHNHEIIHVDSNKELEKIQK